MGWFGFGRKNDSSSQSAQASAQAAARDAATRDTANVTSHDHAQSRHVVDFYEKPGCHLCEDAYLTVAAEVERAGAELRRHNILEDKDLQHQYGELIPVVVIDGEQHSTWFVQEARLRKSLE